MSLNVTADSQDAYRVDNVVPGGPLERRGRYGSGQLSDLTFEVNAHPIKGYQAEIIWKQTV